MYRLSSCNFFRFPNLQFEYQKPTPNFDRARVKGLVAKLIRISDVTTATALEVTAGGKVHCYYTVHWLIISCAFVSFTMLSLITKTLVNYCWVKGN